MLVWLRVSKLLVGVLLVCLSLACQNERELLSDEVGGAVCNPFENNQFVDLAGAYGVGSPKLFAGCLVVGQGAAAKRQLAYLFEGGAIRASGGSIPPGTGSNPNGPSRPNGPGGPTAGPTNTSSTLRFDTRDLSGTVPMVFYAFPKQVTTGPNPSAASFCNSLDVEEPLSCLKGDSPSCLFALTMKPKQASVDGLHFSFDFPKTPKGLGVQQGSACQLVYPRFQLTKFSITTTKPIPCICENSKSPSYAAESDWPLEQKIMTAGIAPNGLLFAAIVGQKLYVYSRAKLGTPFVATGKSIDLLAIGGRLRFAADGARFAVFFSGVGSVQTFRYTMGKEATVKIESQSVIRSPDGFIGLLADVAYLSNDRIALAWYSGTINDAVWIYDSGRPTRHFKVDMHAPQSLTSDKTGNVLFVGGREDISEPKDARAAFTVLRFVPATLGALLERKTFFLRYKGTNVRRMTVSHDNRLLVVATGQNLFQDTVSDVPQSGNHGHVVLWPMNPFTNVGLDVQREEKKKAFQLRVGVLALRRDGLLAITGSDISESGTYVRYWSIASSAPEPGLPNATYYPQAQRSIFTRSHIEFIENCQRLISFHPGADRIRVWRSCSSP